MEDIKRKMEQAKQTMYEYEGIDGDLKIEQERMEIADLIVENKLLLDRVDNIIGKPSE